MGLQRYNAHEMSKMSKVEKIGLLVLAIYLIARVLGFFGTDYKRKLVDILKEPDEIKKRDDLHELAIEVGAGAENTVFGTPYEDPLNENATKMPHTEISESELVNNINIALQTEQAAKSNQIAVLALLVAIGSGFYTFHTTSQIKKDKSSLQ